MSPEVRLRLKKFILWAAPLAGLACGGDGGTDVVLPSLRITTATSGVELDTDGYGVSVDGQAAQPIGPNATLTVDRLTEGQHAVELSGIAGNCAVGGDNPQTVSVAPGATASAAFVITCSAGTGSVQVVTATSGPGTDPDGFFLLFDGADQGPIGVAGTSNLAGIAAGTHSVGLTGLAANCQVAGENPRVVTVAAGGMAQVAFAVTCTAPGPTTGNLEIATATTGPSQDADGYLVSVDGGTGQPIGTNTAVTLANVSATAHTVQLLGLAANCSIVGANPLQATVSPGGTARVAFAVTCTATGPTTGTLEVVTASSGPSPDPDGYQFSVDGGTAQPIGTSATVSLANVSAAQHTVELLGVAANCSVTGDNPLGVAVQAGETARVSFSVTCVATAGSLRIRIDGLPAAVDGAVTVTGPENFSRVVTETTTLGALPPGSYTVGATDVTGGGTTYTPSVSRPTVSVTAGATVTVTVSYTAQAPAPTLNLRIDGLYLTQSTQTYASGVPLVAGRAGYLRVFVVANETNTASPVVRVRLSRPGAEQTLTITAPGGQTPTQVQEGTLGSSWNIAVPASLIQPGLSIFAEVDPGNDVQEINEGDNRFPASGSKALTVRAVPALAVRFVRILQTANNLEGTVGNTGQLVDMARRMYPLNSVQTDLRSSVLSVAGPLLRDDVNSWGQVLSDLDGARVADPDGSSWTYYGSVKIDYTQQQGIVGQAFQGVPLAIGWDDPGDASRVVAHELGHTWNMLHTPCGNPPSVDGGYPYGNGTGVFGFDVAAGRLKPPSHPDIMGYCLDPWISDYTFRKVLDFRQANPDGATFATAVPQPSILIWGRIVNSRPILEPSFEIVARPSLPKKPGPYSVSASAVDGSRLFTLSFDVAAAEDGPAGNGHFAFAVPLDRGSASRLGNLRLAGPGGGADRSPASAELRAEAISQSIVARRQGENVSLSWDAAAHPMIMVRDPDTGEVLSFARGGTALVRTAKDRLDLDISNGVRSQRVRLAINRS